MSKDQGQKLRFCYRWIRRKYPESVRNPSNLDCTQIVQMRDDAADLCKMQKAAPDGAAFHCTL